MRGFLRALADLLRGLFAFPERTADARLDAGRALEERYRRPSRCC